MSERQSDALEAYRRLKTNLVEGLGIDPGPTLRTLYERILHQQPVDGMRAAQVAAEEATFSLDNHINGAARPTVASLRDTTGRAHPVLGTATRIGRSPANDIVLASTAVSRHHAVIVDTGTGFVITDLRSANGVYVSSKRIHVSATVHEGDQIRIGDDEFTFEYTSQGDDREIGCETTR
jgi:hypothetical protein